MGRGVLTPIPPLATPLLPHTENVVLVYRLSEIRNGFPGPKPFSAMLAYSCNVKFSQNLPNLTKFYSTWPSVLRILESLLVWPSGIRVHEFHANL